MQNNDEVFDNFRRFVVKVKKEYSKAAVDEMLVAIQGYSTANVPVDTTNLALSIFRDLREKGNSWAGVVYYTAEYAGWVHEMTGKLRGKPREHFGTTKDGVSFGGGSLTGNYWDGYGGQPAKTQFLAKAAEEMILKDFDRIIRKYY